MNKIKVMIVEDSPTIRELLHHVIDHDPRLEVAAMVSSGEEALRKLPSVAPDVISMDIQLPGMSGLEATRRVMAEQPTPIVVVSANAKPDDEAFTMDALRAGALSVVEKPAGTRHGNFAAMAERLCTQLAAMSQVKVVRQHSSSTKALAKSPDLSVRKSDSAATHLGIVASTGGPKAVCKVLEGLGAAFPLPILVVQHMTASFIPAFATWLADNCPQQVTTVGGPTQGRPGTVYLAPVDHHLLLRGRFVTVDDSSLPVTAHRPSGDVLLQSMAESAGAGGIGVILTGMGADGAQGLLAMHRAGARTIAEDASTAVVYGMPNAAVRLGAAQESLPLDDIAGRLLHIAAQRKEAV